MARWRKGGPETRFYCGACGQPVYRYESFPLCPLCEYAAHMRRLQEAVRARKANNGRPEGADDGSTSERHPKV